MGLCWLKGDLGREADVIVWLTVTELQGGAVKHTILERNEVLVLIQLECELLVQEQLSTLLHHTLFESSLLELETDVVVRLDLLFTLT